MTKGVIATPHRLAGEAGAQVLRDGGNAIDAAVAADAVLCVVYPHMTSVAGDLMAIVWPAGAAGPVGLIGAGRSGQLATIDAVRQRGHEVMPERGVLTVTVPGTVEAWGRLIERFGTLGWSAVLEPAAALAHDGYAITRHVSDALKSASGLLGREPAAATGITIAGNRPVGDYISFTSLGHARRHDGALQMGTFTICRRGQDTRKVVLANSGRVRIDVTHEPCP